MAVMRSLFPNKKVQTELQWFIVFFVSVEAEIKGHLKRFVKIVVQLKIGILASSYLTQTAQ